MSKVHEMIEKLSMVIATVFGIGYMPKCPGTAASLATAAVIFVLPEVDMAARLMTIVWLFGMGLGAIIHAEKRLGVHDSPVIVIDEVCGMAIALLLVPKTLVWYGAAFALFRFFDIVKPSPIRDLERRITGAFGIMLDDVLAGLASMGIVLLVQRFLMTSQV